MLVNTVIGRQFIQFTGMVVAATVWAKQALDLPFFFVVLVKMGLHIKNKSNLFINVARPDFLEFLVPTSAP